MTTRTARPPATAAGSADRLRTRLLALTLDAGAALGAGAVAGLVAIGAGSRLSMRIVALTSGRIGTGVRPESGAVPGELTGDGTMFLLLAGTVAGAIVAVLVRAVTRHWLDVTTTRGSWTYAVLAAFPFALVLLEPANRDFGLFGPTWLAVLIFTACPVGYALLLRWLVRRWAVPTGRWRRGLRAAAGVVGLGLAVLPGVGSAGLRMLGLAISVIGVLVVAGSVTAAEGRWSWWHSPRVHGIGTVVLSWLAVAAVATTLVRIALILV